MTDPDNLAYHAGQALDNPALKYVLDLMESGFIDRMLKAASDDDRRLLCDEARAVKRIRDELIVLKAQMERAALPKKTFTA